MWSKVPLYEYQCARCGRFELIQRFADAPLTTCPTCNGEVQKLLSAPAIQFKGSGWYVTDYARKSAGGASEAKNSEPATPGGSKEASTSAGASTTSKDSSGSGGTPSSK